MGKLFYIQYLCAQQETEAEVTPSGAELEKVGPDSLAAKSFDQYLACQEKVVNTVASLKSGCYVKYSGGEA